LILGEQRRGSEERQQQHPLHQHNSLQMHVLQQRHTAARF
jgi:hypothetical protein